MIPPPTRKIACRLTTTYAGFSGESQLLETLYKRGQTQPEIAPGLFAGDGLLMAWHHQPVAPWQTENWLAEMRRSLRPNQSLRMIENRFVSSEFELHLARRLGCLRRYQGNPGAHRQEPADLCRRRRQCQTRLYRDRRLHLGARGATRTAGVAPHPFSRHRKSRSTSRRPSRAPSSISTDAIASSRFYSIHGNYSPCHSGWRSRASRSRSTRRASATSPSLRPTSYEIISGRNFVTYPSEYLRLAISRAVAIETSRGWRIGKEKQSHKIDIVVALALAALGAMRSQSESSYRHQYALGRYRPRRSSGRAVVTETSVSDFLE